MSISSFLGLARIWQGPCLPAVRTAVLATLVVGCGGQPHAAGRDRTSIGSIHARLQGSPMDSIGSIKVDIYRERDLVESRLILPAPLTDPRHAVPLHGGDAF